MADNRMKNADETMLNANYLGAIDNRNVLLKQNNDRGFSDRTAETGVGLPGWSWNAKFVDLDQDGWLDLYVATGEHFGSDRDANVLYRNTGSKGFEQKTREFGLSDLIPTTAYALLDFDRDGDMDIIRAPGMSHSIVHRNDRPRGDALWIRLEDELGNSRGIGSRISVRSTGTQNSTQTRQIKASGGFVSFDPAKAHFGLGSGNIAKTISVNWPDGASTTISGTFPGNSEIIIRRTASQ